MENNYFITNEPNELVANLLKPVEQPSGKLIDWQNGYGKYTFAIILLFVGCNAYTEGLPTITIDNWLGSLYAYARIALPFLILLYVSQGSSKNNKNLLVINSKGILYNEDIFFWNDILSFQLSLEKEMNKRYRYHVYYLHLRTKSKRDLKINISVYNKKLDEIHNALLKNVGEHEVKDLGFTQII